MRITPALGLLAGVSLLAACATQPPGADIQTQTQPSPQAQPRKYTMEDLKVPNQEPPAPFQAPSYAFDKGSRPSEAAIQRGVAEAQERALELPVLDCFEGAECNYWFDATQQYKVYMAQNNQTLTCFKTGEIIREVKLPGKQVYIKHERATWGSGDKEQQCVSWMPANKGLDKQAFIMTDERMYKLRIITLGPNSRSANVLVRWKYPEDYLRQLNGESPAPRIIERDRLTGLAYRDRYCDYQLEASSTPAWMPEKTPDGQPPVCDDGQVTVINFPLGMSYTGEPSVWAITEDGTRTPIQYGRINSTYRVAGVHKRIRLGLGAEEIDYVRADPVSFRAPSAQRKHPATPEIGGDR